jgi:signal transduction histidine kinase
MRLKLQALFNPQSLAGRLFISAVVLSVLVLAIAGAILSAINHRTVEAAFDERLKLYLKVLVADVASLTDGGNVEPGNLGEPQFQIPLSGWYWQIIRVERANGASSILRTSRSLFSNRLPSLLEPDKPATQGDFRDGYLKGPEGKRIRVVEQEIDLGEQNRFVISVAGNAEEIAEEGRRFDLTLLFILSILAIALAVSALFQVRFGLIPLRRLSRSLGEVRTGLKDHVEGDFPAEVAPLAQELNQVLDVNREVVARARGQVGNLAHALKTPLSVLLNEAGNEGSALAGKVREQSAIMRDQVQFYLDRARAVARAVTIGNLTEIDPVLAALLRTFEKIYAERDITFTKTVETERRFRGEKQDLEEMIGNLVDNAGKWARSHVHVRLENADPGEAPGMVRILVDDDGPGLAEEQRLDVTKRGRRLDETKPGSGLGLSIVVDLAALYGGTFTLHDAPDGGLRAKLLLPAL